MEFRAEARFQRVSPQKARLVLDLIKGRRVEEALETAAFTKKRIAAMVESCCTSAVDNANYSERGKGPRCRCRQPLRQAGDRQRRSAHEADSSGADGARVSLLAPADAHRICVSGRARR